MYTHYILYRVGGYHDATVAEHMAIFESAVVGAVERTTSRLTSRLTYLCIIRETIKYAAFKKNRRKKSFTTNVSDFRGVPIHRARCEDRKSTVYDNITNV